MNDTAPKDIRCQQCDHVIGMERDGKLKISVRSRLVAVRKSGWAETNCPQCKSTVTLPLRFTGGGDA